MLRPVSAMARRALVALAAYAPASRGRAEIAVLVFSSSKANPGPQRTACFLAFLVQDYSASLGHVERRGLCTAGGFARYAAADMMDMFAPKGLENIDPSQLNEPPPPPEKAAARGQSEGRR